jgi:hypothetical protein
VSFEQEKRTGTRSAAYSVAQCGSTGQFWAFISFTRSRTVSSTPWTGDQLVARTLLSVPGDCDDDGEVGRMNGFGRGHRSTRRKPAPTPLCPP